MKKRGMFITFEGPEGSGKTTHSKKLAMFLKKKGFKILHTREPGGTAISEKIRNILLDPQNKKMDVSTEMLLYMAARVEIMKQKVLPALNKGRIVICDRFLDATLAYQGYAGGLDIGLIRKLGQFVTEGRMPDITFLLDIDVKLGLIRAGKEKDRIESKSLAYHRKVRRGYLSIAKNEPKRVKVFSSMGEISRTQEKIRGIALKKLKEKTYVV